MKEACDKFKIKGCQIVKLEERKCRLPLMEFSTNNNTKQTLVVVDRLKMFGIIDEAAQCLWN